MNKVEGVIFDWAGTTVDFGCFAPVNVFINIFKNAGIAVTMEEARAPMGMLKIDHIRAMLSMPRISNLWEDQYGRAFTEQDVENLYAEFEPALLASHLRSPLSELIWSIQPAIVEEIIFRGFILGILLKNFSKPFSITLSLLLFISIHLLNGPVGMLSAAIFGLILIGMRLHTRSILPGIVVHYFVNEQILVLALPIILYCFFITIDFFRRWMKDTKATLSR